VREPRNSERGRGAARAGDAGDWGCVREEEGAAHGLKAPSAGEGGRVGRVWSSSGAVAARSGLAEASRASNARLSMLPARGPPSCVKTPTKLRQSTSPVAGTAQAHRAQRLALVARPVHASLRRGGLRRAQPADRASLENAPLLSSPSASVTSSIFSLQNTSHAPVHAHPHHRDDASRRTLAARARASLSEAARRFLTGPSHTQRARPPPSQRGRQRPTPNAQPRLTRPWACASHCRWG
jgi:hypothetical protein